MGNFKNVFDFYEREADVILELPRPPSVNGLYATVGKRRVKSKEYSAWKKKVSKIVEDWIFQPITEDIIVVYSLQKPVQKRKRDVANYEKALSDFLVSELLIEDDSQIVLNVQRWIPEEIGENVICEIFILTADVIML